MSTVPAPTSADEALAMLRAGMSYLAAADPTSMTTQTQADCLAALEQLDSMETAAPPARGPHCGPAPPTPAPRPPRPPRGAAPPPPRPTARAPRPVLSRYVPF